MEIRHFSKKIDLAQSVDLRKYVFHSAYTDQKAEDYKILLSMADKIGAFEDSHLLGQILNLPVKINFYGTSLSAVGINHVGVYPENRGQGIASKLMLESLKSAEANNQVLAILQPFSPSFYRHFGFDLFTERLNYHIPDTCYPAFPMNNKIKIVRRVPGSMNVDEISKIKDIYLVIAKSTQGMQLRDDIWWDRQLAQYPDLNYALAYYQTSLVGFVSYQIIGTEMKIVDFIYSSNVIRQQLWNFLTAHRANVFEISGVSTRSHQLSYDFIDPRIKQQIWLDTMVRIIDVKEFLIRCIDVFDLRTRIGFNLIDNMAPWNTGFYSLSSNEVKQSEIVDNVDQVSVQQLVAILLGPLNAKQLQQYFEANMNNSLRKLIHLSNHKEISHFLGEF